MNHSDLPLTHILFSFDQLPFGLTFYPYMVLLWPVVVWIQYYNININLILILTQHLFCKTNRSPRIYGQTYLYVIDPRSIKLCYVMLCYVMCSQRVKSFLSYRYRSYESSGCGWRSVAEHRARHWAATSDLPLPSPVTWGSRAVTRHSRRSVTPGQCRWSY